MRNEAFHDELIGAWVLRWIKLARVQFFLVLRFSDSERIYQKNKQQINNIILEDLSTLWLFNIAMENGPFIDGLPIKNGDFPWLC